MLLFFIMLVNAVSLGEVLVKLKYSYVGVVAINMVVVLANICFCS